MVASRPFASSDVEVGKKNTSSLIMLPTAVGEAPSRAAPILVAPIGGFSSNSDERQDEEEWANSVSHALDYVEEDVR